MANRLNYTERQTIFNEDCSILLEEQGGFLQVTSQIDVAGYEFPEDAEIVLTAYMNDLEEYISLGRVGNPTGVRNAQLRDFSVSSIMAVKFRIEVISKSGGLLLGSTRRLKIQRPQHDHKDSKKQPLLPFYSDPNMGQLLWKLDFQGETPRVAINGKLPDWNAFHRDERFVATVYPEILRGVARWVLDEFPEDEDMDGHEWVVFFKQMDKNLKEVRDMDDQRQVEWIDELVSGFASKHNLFDKIVKLQDREREME